VADASLAAHEEHRQVGQSGSRHGVVAGTAREELRRESQFLELWWHDKLVTFSGQLYMDYEQGELPDDLRLARRKRG
jgi:hypothetical protein